MNNTLVKLQLKHFPKRTYMSYEWMRICVIGIMYKAGADGAVQYGGHDVYTLTYPQPLALLKDPPSFKLPHSRRMQFVRT